ncbi:uncharacterized protein Z518_09599 [Rhinocladiella mackenziei CBS 650.93]|uniref:Amidohydrolase-related domain-containing protein n=1 Tax=Rhinocladiella mackenziei CBS 650.93 TaxID=1442369 RepID=A0A0D2FIL9_9EURO|nr:uncharacterized protein Z518_09599 [Rhinocladiella mackenziei CBS 650.93]KIX01872.1 hypothetical protein Z518_09599 [Rhinocladiella mackenziei CBS 650.93]
MLSRPSEPLSLLEFDLSWAIARLHAWSHRNQISLLRRGLSCTLGNEDLGPTGKARSKRTPASQKTTSETFSEKDLLSSNILLFHANNLTPGNPQLLQSRGADISATRSTELEWGTTETRYALSQEVYNIHPSVWTAILPGPLTCLVKCCLHANRSEKDATVEDVFNLGTIFGVATVGLKKETGSLKKGMKADIVIFEGSTPSMLGSE